MTGTSSRHPSNNTPYPMGSQMRPGLQGPPLSQQPTHQVQPVSIGTHTGENAGAPSPVQNTQRTASTGTTPMTARAGQPHSQTGGNTGSLSPAQAWSSRNTPAQASPNPTTTPAAVRTGQPHPQTGGNTGTSSPAQAWSARHTSTQGTNNSSTSPMASRAGRSHTQIGGNARRPSPAQAWNARNPQGTTSTNTAPVAARAVQPHTQAGGYAGTPAFAQTQSARNTARTGPQQAPPQPPNGPRLQPALPPAAVASLLSQAARAPAQLSSQPQHGQLAVPGSWKGSNDSASDAIKNFLADAIDDKKRGWLVSSVPQVELVRVERLEWLRDLPGDFCVS